MRTVFSAYANAELIFDVSIGTFIEDPSTLNMIPESRKEIIKCMLRYPRTNDVKEYQEAGNDEKGVILKGHAVSPSLFPNGIRVGNVATAKISDSASDRIEEGLFEVLSLQQSPYAVVSRMKGHYIKGLFTLIGTGGIGRG
jgi:hypothetical protein